MCKTCPISMFLLWQQPRNGGHVAASCQIDKQTHKQAGMMHLKSREACKWDVLCVQPSLAMPESP